MKVVLDNFKAAYMATTHLIERGCKRIVHIAGKQTSAVYIDRLKGYKHALAEHGIKYSPALVLHRGVDAAAAPLLAQDILEMSPRPDGVFAVNDLCAVMCMKALQKAGVKIPGDIAFVGFNNDMMSTVIEPNLTTVNYSGEEIGEVVATMIIDEIRTKKETRSNYTITLQPELIVRESTNRK